MSAQAAAKLAQGYQAKPVPSTCGNCAHFRSEMQLSKWFADKNKSFTDRGMEPHYSIKSHGLEVAKFCTIGNFAVNKAATCAKFAPKVAP